MRRTCRRTTAQRQTDGEVTVERGCHSHAVNFVQLHCVLLEWERFSVSLCTNRETKLGSPYCRVCWVFFLNLLNKNGYSRMHEKRREMPDMDVLKIRYREQAIFVQEGGRRSRQ